MNTRYILLFLLILICNSSLALIDPTRPPNTSKITTQQTVNNKNTLDVSGIIKTKQGYQAIINKKYYSIGDDINHLKITNITKHTVYFYDGESQFPISIQQGNTNTISIKKSSSNSRRGY